MEDRAWKERWRGSAASRGYDSRWQRKREHVLRRDGCLCQQCKRVGRLTTATEVHHVVKIVDAPELRLEDSNLVSVCRDCHELLEMGGSMR